jgi:hypothetical protein
MRRMLAVMVGAALIARASVALGVWTVNADGNCVQEWGAADMLRGPTAIVTALQRPFWTAAGGAEYAWNKTEWRWWRTLLLGSAVTGVSAAAGVFEGVWWVGTGAADTLTGGFFHLAPEPATQLSVQPVLSTVISDQPPAAEDHCGRAAVAAK